MNMLTRVRSQLLIYTPETSTYTVILQFISTSRKNNSKSYGGSSGPAQSIEPQTFNLKNRTKKMDVGKVDQYHFGVEFLIRAFKNES